jgi:hypothetical protein
VGLLKELVLLPVAPLRFTIWTADKVAAEADRQQYSTGAGVRQIDEIEEAREKGEIGEEEAEALEGKIIEGQARRARPSAAEEEEDSESG